MAEYPEILADAAEALATALERQGIEPEHAADMAFEAVEELRARWGGLEVYIPKAEFLDLAPKYQGIYERYKANYDIRVIARDAGYTVRRVRQIIRAARLMRAVKVHAPPLLELDG